MFPHSPCITLIKSRPTTEEYRLTIKTSTGFAAVRFLGDNDRKSRVAIIRASGRTIQRIKATNPIAIWSCKSAITNTDNRGNPLVQGSIESLDCSQNQLDDIQFTGNCGLKQLNCSSNKLKKIELRSFIPGDPFLAIEELDCSKNSLTQLNLSELKHLQTIVCAKNKLSSITLGCLPLLKSIDCTENELVELDLSKIRHLRFLDARNNPLGKM